MLIYPQASRALPANRLEAHNHTDGMTYVIERPADFSDPRLPAPIRAAIDKRPSAAAVAKEADLRALFDRKQAEAAAAQRETAYATFLASDPDAQVIKAR